MQHISKIFAETTPVKATNPKPKKIKFLVDNENQTPQSSKKLRTILPKNVTQILASPVTTLAPFITTGPNIQAISSTPTISIPTITPLSAIPTLTPINAQQLTIQPTTSQSTLIRPRFDYGRSLEITRKIIEEKDKNCSKNTPEKSRKEKSERQKEPLISRLTKVLKRKNFYTVGRRQRGRIQQQIKQIFSETTDYLRSLGLCLSNVELNPIELDEADFKLKIRPPTSDCPDKLEPNVNNLLYYKDKHAISDHAYSDMKKRCYLPIPSITKLKERRAEINSMFEIHDNDMGVYLSLKDKLEFRARIYLENKYPDGNYDSKKFTDDTLYIKLSADGTNIGRNLKLLNFTFTIINEGSKAKTANGNYTIGIFEIDHENYDTLTKCFKELIEELRNLKEITIDEKKLNLVYYFCGDWKILAQITGLLSANAKYPCIWCKCCKEEFFDLDKEWSLVDPAKGCRTYEEHITVINKCPKEMKEAGDLKFGYNKPPVFGDILPIKNYIIDMLHLYLRISDNLFNLLVKDCSLLDNFEMGSISRFDVTQYTHLNNLQKFLNEKCNVKFTFLWTPETKKLNWRDLVGPEKNRLFENLDLSAIIPEFAKLDMLSKIWNDFYEIMRKVRAVEVNGDELKQLTRQWLIDFLNVYGRTSVTPYTHAFVFHLHEFVDLYKDINAFNCQGLEKLNDMSTGQYFKGTNKRDSALAQILQKRNRMEYLSPYVLDES
ncbi:unnamed protein product [Brachionus calyciflorus]|uniref:Uncharacterized protein n=1 Tax=Brachionus calyciflorus TaxID=104777 RepID=A0A813VAN1_9BILA|nr:unnamed protein product [Brachionus calyciflorus]